MAWKVMASVAEMVSAELWDWKSVALEVVELVWELEEQL